MKHKLALTQHIINIATFVSEGPKYFNSSIVSNINKNDIREICLKPLLRYSVFSVYSFFKSSEVKFIIDLSYLILFSLKID